MGKCVEIVLSAKTIVFLSFVIMIGFYDIRRLGTSLIQKSFFNPAIISTFEVI
jgi:K+ transporter